MNENNTTRIFGYVEDDNFTAVTIDLTQQCDQCTNGKIVDYVAETFTTCRNCAGRGVYLSDSGETLLRFLKEWGGQS